MPLKLHQFQPVWDACQQRCPILGNQRHQLTKRTAQERSGCEVSILMWYIMGNTAYRLIREKCKQPITRNISQPNCRGWPADGIRDRLWTDHDDP